MVRVFMRAVLGLAASPRAGHSGDRRRSRGRAYRLASRLNFEILPGLPGLVGAWFDLQCTPLADGSVRFANHGDYVSRVVQQASALQRGGHLLEADTEALKDRTADAEVGLPGPYEW